MKYLKEFQWIEKLIGKQNYSSKTSITLASCGLQGDGQGLPGLHLEQGAVVLGVGGVAGGATHLAGVLAQHGAGELVCGRVSEHVAPVLLLRLAVIFAELALAAFANVGNRVDASGHHGRPLQSA